MKLNFGTRGVAARRELYLDHMVAVQDVSSGVHPKLSRPAQAMALLGLQYNRPFHRNSLFLLLLALGPIVWLAMIGFFAFQPLPLDAVWSAAFFSVALWKPLYEELLFRGILQSYLLQSMGQKTWHGLSLANLLTSLSFTLAHLASHSTSWALLVLIPSLCFGFVRDRFGSVYPSITLHVFYNTGYFLLIDGGTFLTPQ
ncbi:MAG: JDVT-CTERM system glutamic-type intramembrane protease [Nitrospira sp.]